ANGAAGSPIGSIIAFPTITATIITNTGVRNFPNQSTNLDGFKDKYHVIPKKIIVKRNSMYHSETNASDKNGFIPISNETAPVRGIAKNGPIAK
ncbi:hypothetical protein OFN37_30180, partial [Escherichia coli]|nr:hypothetical protein [Escherichia coli]